MTQIGTFKRTKTGLSGRIRTLAFEADLILIPVDKSDAENAPDYRIHLLNAEDAGVGPEVGAGWKRSGEKAGDYVSVRLDDPLFPQPIRAGLFQADEKRTTFNLLWNRPPRRNEAA